MSYDRHEATEQPTTTRLKRAREEGHVARSSDLSSALLSLVAIGLAFLWLPSMLENTTKFLSQGISYSSVDPSMLLMEAGSTLLHILWLPCVVLFLGAIFSGVIQVGGIFAPSAAKFDHHHVDPTLGWSRVCGSRGWMNLLFSCSKLSFAVLSAGAVCWSYRTEILSVGGFSVIESISITGVIAGKMALAAASSLLILGLFDATWQRYQWKIGLRMTYQEVIAERREQEGNSIIHTRRKSIYMSRQRKENVMPSLVLIGKIHSVLIRWNPATMSTPVVLAFIREEEIDKHVRNAKQHHIPVQLNHWLCQRIEKSCDVGSSIPPSLHSEIASSLTTSRRKTA